MTELPLTRENVERLHELTNYAVLNPFKLPLSSNMLQGYGHIEHAEFVAAQERIVQYFRAKLEEFLPQQRPMDFEEWEAVVQDAADRALDSTEASIGFLLTPRGSNALPMQRFQIISPAEEPFAFLAREALAGRGLTAGNMSSPELRFVQRAARDQGAGSPSPTAAGEYSSSQSGGRVSRRRHSARRRS
jgi:hypothetical protein